MRTGRWAVWANAQGRAPALAVVVGALWVFAAGCGQQIQTEYGQSKGTRSASVNGTSVLAEMFSQAGHRVSTWRWLSPKLRERADVIVWFGHDFSAPAAAARNWFDQWLTAEPDRVLIYVGRDFDAAGAYWQKVRSVRAAEKSEENDESREISRRLAEARHEFRHARQAIPASESSPWFDVEGQMRHRRIRSLDGKPEWLRGVHPERVEVELHGRLIPPKDAEVWLGSEGDALVSAQRIGRSRFILVANGSFLLNLALVNHEHRKLAAQLIGEVGAPVRNVVFLDAGTGGPMILKDDPGSMLPGLEIFGVWPLDYIFLHLTAVAILFGFARFPIFGLPRTPGERRTVDFGQHVAAVGDLLEMTADREYAVNLVRQYQQGTRSAPDGSRTAPRGFAPARSPVEVKNRP